VLHAARYKYRTQKWCKNRHLLTIAQLCRAISSQLRHVSTIGKKLLSSNMSSACSHNMLNVGPLAAGSLRHPCKFQRVSRLCSVTARHSSSGRQPNCGVEQRAPPVFGRTAITLGIGPHSSFISFYDGTTRLNKKKIGWATDGGGAGTKFFKNLFLTRNHCLTVGGVYVVARCGV